MSITTRLTRLALGLTGRLRPRPPVGDPQLTLRLPPAEREGGCPLMQALAARRSGRDFAPDPLPLQTLSNLLWATAGINRDHDGGRTMPSAMNSQEVLLYVAMPQGLYRYEPGGHLLQLAVAADVRGVTGIQSFAAAAPVNLVCVLDHSRGRLLPADRHLVYGFACAGAMTQNAYLYCASAGLACVVRALFDPQALSRAMALSASQQPLLAQSIGLPAAIPA